MPRYQKNPRPEDSVSREPSLESSDESRPHQDQLDVRPQNCPSQVRLQKELFHTVTDLGARPCDLRALYKTKETNMTTAHMSKKTRTLIHQLNYPRIDHGSE